MVDVSRAIVHRPPDDSSSSLPYCDAALTLTGWRGVSVCGVLRVQSDERIAVGEHRLRHAIGQRRETVNLADVASEVVDDVQREVRSVEADLSDAERERLVAVARVERAYRVQTDGGAALLDVHAYACARVRREVALAALRSWGS